MAQRARWTSKYEKGLVDVLTEYNLSHYHGQNGWCSSGWNQIVRDVNKLFPEAKFTKSQIQDKEAQLKKDYKAIKSIVKCSGISWNLIACIINTTTEKWDEIVEEDSKLRRYENKSFPLFEALDLLYEGQLAQRKHCFTSSQSTHVANTSCDVGAKKKTHLSTSRKHLREERESTMNPPPIMTVMESQGSENYTIEEEGQNSICEVERRHAIGRSFDYQVPQDHNDEEFGAEDGDGEQEAQRSGDLANSRSENGGTQGVRPKKLNGPASIPRIEETMLAYVDLKREQASKKEQVSKQEHRYPISRCLEV